MIRKINMNIRIAIVLVSALLYTIHATSQSEYRFAPEDAFKLAPPNIKASDIFFKDMTQVQMDFAYPDAIIRYTLDGQAPDENSDIYTTPLSIKKPGEIIARAFHPEIMPSDEVRLAVLKTPISTVTKMKKLMRQPHEKYRGEGIDVIFNRVKGSEDFADGQWLGFDGGEIGFQIDYHFKTNIKKIQLSVLHNPGSWIFLPESVELKVSKNGKKYKSVALKNGLHGDENTDQGFHFIDLPVNAKNIKYMQLIIRTPLEIPDWHPGKGTPPWFFIDEIIIE